MTNNTIQHFPYSFRTIDSIFKCKYWQKNLHFTWKLIRTDAQVATLLVGIVENLKKKNSSIFISS